MKIDHLVINVDKQYHLDNTTIEMIRDNGFPYEPKWGKGTKGFKATNIWIGNEYFEMVRLLNQEGGGWKPDWITRYNKGDRGLICLMIDVNDINAEYNRLYNRGIPITEPEFLKFKWFFKLLTRTMPWKNSYLDYFQGIPMQIGFQQMKDKKALNFMRSYMVPNSKDNGITGIKKIVINGNFTDEDFNLIKEIFKNAEQENDLISVYLLENQELIFKRDSSFFVDVYTNKINEDYDGNTVTIENVNVY